MLLTEGKGTRTGRGGGGGGSEILDGDPSGLVLALFGGLGEVGSVEGDAVYGDGGPEAGVVIGALAVARVLREGPQPLLAQLLKLALVHCSPLAL